MKSLRPVLIFADLVVTLLASGMASAATSSRGGGFSGGGHYGSYRGGGFYGRGYYGPYWGGGYWGRGYWGHSHGSVSVVIGAPFWGPWGYYPYGYYPYYSAPAVAVPSTPQVYVEPAQPSRPSRQSGVWYFCQTQRRITPMSRSALGAGRPYQHNRLQSSEVMPCVVC